MRDYLLGALLVRLSEPGIDMAGTNIWSSVILGIKQKNKFVCQSLFSNFSFPFSLSYFCNGGQSYRIEECGNYCENGRQLYDRPSLSASPTSIPYGRNANTNTYSVVFAAYNMTEMQIEIPVYNMAEIPVYNMAEIPVQILFLWYLLAYNMTDLQIQILILWYLQRTI